MAGFWYCKTPPLIQKITINRRKNFELWNSRIMTLSEFIILTGSATKKQMSIAFWSITFWWILPWCGNDTQKHLRTTMRFHQCIFRLQFHSMWYAMTKPVTRFNFDALFIPSENWLSCVLNLSTLCSFYWKKSSFDSRTLKRIKVKESYWVGGQLLGVNRDLRLPAE